MWWEAPSRWNPCMTPREELEGFRRHRAKYDEADQKTIDVILGCTYIESEPPDAGV